MKKEDLINLGIDDDLAKQVMGLHGKTVTTLNAQIGNLESERDQFKQQLDSNQTELDTLRESAKGNDELTKQLTELQDKYDAIKTESETKLAQQQKDSAIRRALLQANPLDEDIVFGQLNLDTIQVTDKGLLGLDEQLNSLKEDKSFLFKQQEVQKQPQIVVGGNPVGQNTSLKSITEYSYDELKDLKDNNPAAFEQLTK